MHIYSVIDYNIIFLAIKSRNDCFDIYSFITRFPIIHDALIGLHLQLLVLAALGAMRTMRTPMSLRVRTTPRTRRCPTWWSVPWRRTGRWGRGRRTLSPRTMTRTRGPGATVTPPRGTHPPKTRPLKTRPPKTRPLKTVQPKERQSLLRSTDM